MTMTDLEWQHGRASDGLVAGRYRLGRRLGHGATGQVWRAFDEELGRTVAVKEVARSLAPYPDAGRLEARAAARVTHCGVVTVHDFIAQDADDTDWIVMEALSGQSLAAVLGREGPISVEEARYIGRHVLGALRAVHDAGLVHGDIKPSNVQLCDDGRVVLLDFGLASAARRDSAAADGVVAGSLPYIAPEIYREGWYSPASDLYALGMTLCVALTGTAPGDEAMPELPRAARALAPVVTGLLDPDPRQRLSAAAAERQL
jgi:serine/threonine protein kinase